MNKNNYFFSVSSLLVLLLFVFFAFGCGGSYDTAYYDDDDLSPLSSEYPEEVYTSPVNENAERDAARIAALQEDLNRARLENQNLNHQLSDLERQLNDKKVNTVSDAIIMDYNEALRLFHARKYGESMARFHRLYSDYPSIDLAPNCVYWIGECYYGMKDYKQAIRSFEQVLSEFPGSIKDDDAFLMMGHSYVKLNNKAKAREFYNTLQDIHPDSPYLKKIPAAFRR